MADDGRDDQAVKVLVQMQVMQDAAKPDAPVGDYSQDVVFRLQRVESWHHIGKRLPARVLVKLLRYQVGELVQASLILFLDEGAQKVGVVVEPEGVDVIVIGPQVTPLARLTIKEVVGLIDA